MVFPGSCKGVSRKFQECFKEVSGIFLGFFKKVARIFQLRWKGVSSSSKGVSRVYEISFNGVSRSFKKI